MSGIMVLGVGPGGSAWVTPGVTELVYSCDVVYGGRRNLQLFPAFPGEKQEVTGNLPLLVETIRADRRRQKKVGVLVSGDPGLFSLMSYLKRYFAENELEVVPGISAMQYFFARIKVSWHDACILSLHGREISDLSEQIRGHPRLGLFTEDGEQPALVCRLMLEEGMKGRLVYLGENLSYPGEKISGGSPGEFTSYCAEDLNVMAVLEVAEGKHGHGPG